MEIEIYKNNTSSDKLETEYLKVDTYGLRIKTKDLLFFKDGTLSLQDSSEIPMYEIHKVQFIASCKTKFKDELLIAFYLGEYSGLCGFIMDELPNGYYSPQGYLIDYKSYSDICALTGEKKMSLIEYYHSVKQGHCDPNSYIKYKDEYLNADEHKNVE